MLPVRVRYGKAFTPLSGLGGQQNVKIPGLDRLGSDGACGRLAVRLSLGTAGDFEAHRNPQPFVQFNRRGRAHGILYWGSVCSRPYLPHLRGGINAPWGGPPPKKLRGGNWIARKHSGIRSNRFLVIHAPGKGRGASGTTVPPPPWPC